jgi:hypothetical protein
MVSEGARQPDWLGRGIGLAVFAGGIVLLILVFTWTNQLVSLLPEAGQKLDQWAIKFGVHLARLFVCGLLGSWIAGRGAQMYAAANRALAGD